METKKINGIHMEKMLLNGLANLYRHEDELNAMNVFPVADGDTGTNMRVTLESGLRAAKSTSELCTYLKAVSEGMLFGARGNSGVILSQLFRGMYLSLSRYGVVNPGEFRDSLVCAYKTAYASVMYPVEGTILTVAREGIEFIRNQIGRGATFESLLRMYLFQMRSSLERTPELLPKLKDSGVVDSGALGYITVVEGMLMQLYGQTVDYTEPVQDAPTGEIACDTALFNENTVFTDGYCLEFILQLMNAERYSGRFNLKHYTEALRSCGSSLVTVQDGKRIKVHIHTFRPAKILELSQEYGEFVTCKVENMQLQRNAREKMSEADAERRPFAVVTVADSERIRTVFSDLGSSYVIYGGAKMSVSVQDFTEAFRSVNADRIAVLPNNANVSRAAHQAGELFSGSTVDVLETQSIPQGYCALAMDIADSTDAEYRIHQMQLGMESTVTLAMAAAVKDYRGTVCCRKGEQVAILDGEIICAGDDELTVFCEGLGLIPDIEDKESCIVFCGESVSDTLRAELGEKITAAFPELEVSFINGGSELYSWTAAVS